VEIEQDFRERDMKKTTSYGCVRTFSNMLVNVYNVTDMKRATFY